MPYNNHKVRKVLLKGERVCEPGSSFVPFLVCYQKTISLRNVMSITILRACSVVPQTSRGFDLGHLANKVSLLSRCSYVQGIYTLSRCVSATRTYIYIYISL